MKESTMSLRQRTIPLIYGVLMLMLALSVSTETMSVFEATDKALDVSIQNAESHSIGSIAQVKEVIDGEISRNHFQHQPIKDSLDFIHTETKKMLAYIDSMSMALLQTPGITNPKTGAINNKNESTISNRFFMGKGENEKRNQGRGNGAAYALHNKIDDYYGFLAGIYNVNRKPVDTVQYLWEHYKILESSREFGVWERKMFNGGLFASLCMLKSLKVDIYQNERKLLGAYRARVGIEKEVFSERYKEPMGILCFGYLRGNSIMPIPKSSTVLLGSNFKARIFVGRIEGEYVPEISITKGSITPIFSQKGDKGVEISIPSNIHVIPKNKKEGKQSYVGSAEVYGWKKKANETVPFSGEFIVRKPEIITSKDSGFCLYRMCHNPVNIDIPALEMSYHPYCFSPHADMYQSVEDIRKWTIVPRGNKCVVSVHSYQNGIPHEMGKVKFTVIEPPKPSLSLTSNGKPLTAASTLRKGDRVTIKIVADAEFKAIFASDARYEVPEIEIYKKCGLLPEQRIGGIFTAGKDMTVGIEIPIPAEAFACASGAQIFFKLKKVERKSFSGQLIEDKRFTPYELTTTVRVQ